MVSSFVQAFSNYCYLKTLSSNKKKIFFAMKTSEELICLIILVNIDMRQIGISAMWLKGGHVTIHYNLNHVSWVQRLSEPSIV